MKLQTIKITNYRSIEELSFDIEELEGGTFTYGLIGVNEAGKSTILKALALKDWLKDEKGNMLPLQKDFKNKINPINIEYTYLLDKEEIKEAKWRLPTAEAVPNPDGEPGAEPITKIIDIDGMDLSIISLKATFEFKTHTQVQFTINCVNIKDENEHKKIIENLLKQFILDKTQKSIFWTAEDRYLISQPINLTQFASSPETISVPLKNCFLLAGITNIQERITNLSWDSTEVELLQTELWEKVTKHIKRVWPNHPIEITFLITDGLIYFHIKDSDSKSKAKTADQRSDGFRQFISFLLTISAQDSNEELKNSILLLDEPETHLHPQAQENLLQELIKITNNRRNNIVFFATHSNYMIDKNNLSRNFKIYKPKDYTEKEQFDKWLATYASVNYSVFGIVNSDYHNELYGYLEELDSVKLDSLNKNKQWIRINKDGTTITETVSLPKYIRHSIHHPENKKNKVFTQAELEESINMLLGWIRQIDTSISVAKSIPVAKKIPILKNPQK